MSDGAENRSSDTGDDIYEASFADAPPPPERRTSWAGLVMIAIVVSILLLPLLFMWGPQERARWQQAAAEEQRLDGDLDGAIDSLDEAVTRFPDQEALYFKRAEWLMDKGDYDRALEDCQRGIELAPHNTDGYRIRSQILQHLARFEEAVADMEKLLEFSERGWGFDRASALNGVAYSRALANTNVEQALDEVEEALSLYREFNGPMLDTRGFIHYLLGDLEKARADLDQAVMLIERENESLAQQLSGDQLGVIDRRDSQLVFQRHSQGVAVIRYHRSLILDSLGETEKAEEDRQRVVELGYEPGTDLF